MATLSKLIGHGTIHQGGQTWNWTVSGNRFFLFNMDPVNNYRFNGIIDDASMSPDLKHLEVKGPDFIVLFTDGNPDSIAIRVIGAHPFETANFPQEIPQPSSVGGVSWTAQTGTV